jgi:alkylhydroperoxidase family enzyme
MARIADSAHGTTAYSKVMGHVPHVLEPWERLEDVFFNHSILPADLLEQVRRTLTLGHGCEYCQSKAGPPDGSHDSFRTSIAVGFAQMVMVDFKGIESREFAVLQEHFSDAEIVELVSFISFMWAGGMFGKIMAIKPV